MDKHIVNLYLARILSGIYVFLYKNQYFKLVYPDIEIKYRAELYSDECYQENKFNDWMTDDAIVSYLIDMGLWAFNGDDQLKKIESQIEDYKVELYDNFLNPPKQKQVRKSLDSLRKRYNQLYHTRHCLDHLTPEGYADILKNQYILIHSIYTNKNELVFPDLQNTNYQYLNELSSIITESNIDVSTFRAIARHDIWRSYWSSNKDHIFDRAVINWTDEQRTLVVLTKMYDSAHENPECPVETVFEDDDMFDGWMIKQRRESEKLRSQNRTEKLLDNKGLGKANEVYIMAKSKDEASSIYQLNDHSSKNIISERAAVLAQKKEIKEEDLPDIKRSIQIQQNQNWVDSHKR